jgi:hypothetical protein
LRPKPPSSELNDVSVRVGYIGERVVGGVLTPFDDASASFDHGNYGVVES